MVRMRALALLALALMLGAGLRFYRLRTAELSADEAASWAGAAAPDLRTVVERQRSLDPGKLALYDAALHGWIRLGGDGAGSMRAFSAVLGTLAIALVFAATCELMLDLGGAALISRAEVGGSLVAPMAGRTSIVVVHAGVLNWSHLRPRSWPLEMLRSASGKAPFMLLLPLAIYGGWRMARDGAGAALGFVLWWMLAPMALVMAVSYAFTPFEEMRYVISSVAAFFILAGIGLAGIDDGRLRLRVLVLVVGLSLRHVRRGFIEP